MSNLRRRRSSDGGGGPGRGGREQQEGRVVLRAAREERIELVAVDLEDVGVVAAAEQRRHPLREVRVPVREDARALWQIGELEAPRSIGLRALEHRRVRVADARPVRARERAPLVVARRHDVVVLPHPPARKRAERVLDVVQALDLGPRGRPVAGAPQPIRGPRRGEVRGRSRSRDDAEREEQVRVGGHEVPW